MSFLRRSTEPAPTSPPPEPWRAISPPSGWLSTGIDALDAALGGGYRQGTVIGIEVTPSAGPIELSAVVVPAIANFLALGGGAIVMQPWGSRAGLWHDALVRHLPKALVDGRFRSLNYSSTETAGPWEVPMARLGRVDGMREMVRAESAARGPDKPGKLLEVNSTDTLEAVVGTDVAVRIFGHGLARARDVGNVELMVAMPGSKIGTRMLGLSDLHLRVVLTPAGLQVDGVRPQFLAVRVPSE